MLDRELLVGRVLHQLGDDRIDLLGLFLGAFVSASVCLSFW
jgi:hypothetical protein